MKPVPSRPPIYTVWVFSGWTFDRTAAMAEDQRKIMIKTRKRHNMQCAQSVSGRSRPSKCASDALLFVTFGMASLWMSGCKMSEMTRSPSDEVSSHPSAIVHRERPPTHRSDNLLGMPFIKIEAGCFQMGSNDGRLNEMPIRQIRITRDFWMGKYEVTQREYEQLMGNNPSEFKEEDFPVENVTWHDAVLFCAELTRREREAGRLPEGLVYRLPTEAEWEYAARGGALAKDTTYAGGNDIDAVAWYGSNSQRISHPVGTKAPNELGLHDMTGNVWEWVHDWHQPRYLGFSAEDPEGPVTGKHRGIRGASWYDRPMHCPMAYREKWLPWDQHNGLGFRVVVAAPLKNHEVQPTSTMADSAREERRILTWDDAKKF